MVDKNIGITKFPAESALEKNCIIHNSLIKSDFNLLLKHSGSALTSGTYGAAE